MESFLETANNRTNFFDADNSEDFLSEVENECGSHKDFLSKLWFQNQLLGFFLLHII